MDDTPLNMFHDHNASGLSQNLTAGQRCSSNFGEKTHIETDFHLDEGLISELGMLPHHSINIAEIDLECDMSPYLGLPQTQSHELDRKCSVCHHQSLLQWREECEALLASMTSDDNETSSIKNLQQSNEDVQLPLMEETVAVLSDTPGFQNQNLGQSIPTLSDAVNFDIGFRINTDQQEMNNLQAFATIGNTQYPTSLSSNSDLQDSEEFFENFDSGFEHTSLVEEFNEYRGSFPVCDVISHDEYYHPTHSEVACPDSLDNLGDEGSAAGLCASLFSAIGQHTNYDSKDTLISGNETLTYEENSTGTDNLVRVSNDNNEHLVMVNNDNKNLVNVCNDSNENYKVCKDEKEILVKVSHNNNVQWSEKCHFTPFRMSFADSLKHSVPVANGIKVSPVQENGGVTVSIPMKKSETNISNNFLNKEFEPSLLHGTDKRPPFPLCLEREVQGHLKPCVRFSDSYAGSDNRPLIKGSSCHCQQDQSLLASGRQDKFGVNIGGETTLSCMACPKGEIKADHNVISVLMPKSVEARNNLVKISQKINIQKMNNEYNFQNSVALSAFAQIPQNQGIANNTVTDPVFQVNDYDRQTYLLNSDETTLSLNKEPNLPNTFSDAYRPLIDKVQSGRDQKELRLSSTLPASCSTERFVGTHENKEGVKVSRGRKSVRVGKSGRFVSVPVDSVNRLMVRDLLSLSGNRPERSIKEATQEYRRDRNRIIMQKQQRLKEKKIISQCPPGSSL